MSKKKGYLGELVARKYLERKGYKFLESNWFCKFSEIDLIMIDGKTTVFVEVKTGSKNSLISPENNFTNKKVKKILKAVNIYLLGKHVFDYRLDLVAIISNKQNRHIFHHYVDVIKLL